MDEVEQMIDEEEQAMRVTLALMSNDELLKLYELMVKVYHYDPHQTPKRAVEMYQANISHYDIHELILQRMSKEMGNS